MGRRLADSQAAALHQEAGAARLRWIVFATYLLMVVGLVILHEPWRDEADAWLVARDVPLIELPALTGHMGTPGLWYVLLAPLAKLGLPYGSMHLLNLGFAAAAAALVLWRAPLPLPVATLLVFSYPLFYEYAVVARSYALASLLLFIAAAAWKGRGQHPWWVVAALGLLAQANVHGLVFAGVLGAVWLVETLASRQLRPRIVHFAMLLGSGIGAVVQLIPAGPSQLETWTRPLGPQLGYLGGFWGLPFVPLDTGLPLGGASFAAVVLVVAKVLAVVVLAGSIVGFLAARQWQAGAFMAICWASLHYVFVYKWFGGARHGCLLLVLVVATHWLAGGMLGAGGPAGALQGWRRLLARVVGGAWCCGLVLSMISALGMARFDLRHQYSHGRQLATFLVANNLVGADIAATFWAESALPYLPRPTLWYAEVAREASHNSWDAAYEAGAGLSIDQCAAVVNRHFANRSRLLFISHQPMMDPAAARFQLVWITEGPVGPSLERFWVYRALPLLSAPDLTP